MLFFLTNSFYQFRKKMGFCCSQIYNSQYKLPSSTSKPYSFNNSRNNTIDYDSSIKKVYSSNNNKNNNNNQNNSININIDNTTEGYFDNIDIHNQSNPTFIHYNNINWNNYNNEEYNKITKKYKNNDRNKDDTNVDINLLNQYRYFFPSQKNKNYYKFGDNTVNKNTLPFNYNSNNNIFNKTAIHNTYIDSGNKYTDHHNYYNNFSNNEIKRYDSIRYFENLLNYHELESNDTDISIKDHNKSNNTGNR